MEIQTVEREKVHVVEMVCDGCFAPVACCFNCLDDTIGPSAWSTDNVDDDGTERPHYCERCGSIDFTAHEAWRVETTCELCGVHGMSLDELEGELEEVLEVA